MNAIKADKAYLTHILESTELLLRHLQRTEAGRLWHQDETVRDAVLRTLQIMAESCSKLSAESKQRAPDIHWKQIVGFRNVLVHDYLGDIDYDRVTQIIHDDLPQLRASVSGIYDELYGPKGKI